MDWSAYPYITICFIPVWSCTTEGTKIPQNPSESSAFDGLQFKGETVPMLAFTQPKPPHTVEVYRYQSVSIHCSAAVVNGVQPRVYWMRNDVAVSPGVNVSDVSDAYYPETALSTVTTSILSLHCVTAEASGDYTCAAETPNGRIETVTKVVVIIGRFSQAMHTAWQRRCPAEELAARIVMSTPRYIQNAEKDILLFCRAVGDPHPTTTWYFHAGPYRNAPEDQLQRIRKGYGNYHVMQSGDLLIRNASKENHGYDISGARNMHGSDFMASYVYPVAVFNRTR